MTTPTPQRVVSYLQQWEYHTHVIAQGLFSGKMQTGNIQDQIGMLGAQGWELVAALPDTNVKGARDGLMLIFKRPVLAQ